MSYAHLDTLRARLKNSPHLSVRGVALKLGVSHSALSRIVRGQTFTVSEHTDYVLTRWLYPEREIPVCVCSRCLQPEVSFKGRVEALEGIVCELRVRVDTLEGDIHARTRTLSPFMSGGV